MTRETAPTDEIAAKLRSCLTSAQWEALTYIARCYGDSTDELLTGLHRTAAIVAAVTGVEPQAFVDGMKAQWDAVAAIVNAGAAPPSDTQGDKP